MKRTLILVACIALSGCARFSTNQTDISYEEGKPVRSITTEASAFTFVTSRSDLAKWKATQSDKTQGAEVGGLSQEGLSTNALPVLRELTELIKALPR